jgi:trehalose 6-phosphate synthase/phosphatase
MMMEASEHKKERIVIVSNREPYSIKLTMDGVTVHKNAGGLVSALEPLVKETEGLWVCWEGESGSKDALSRVLNKLAQENRDEYFPLDMVPVALTDNEINHYYNGYANRVLWPLFHYMTSYCNFWDELAWPSYHSANQKFANTVVTNTQETDLIWVQDYHLMLVPGMIRQFRSESRLGWFCHIPFPNYEVFRHLPNRLDLLRGVLGADLIGFHVPSYVHHFLECVERGLLEDVSVNHETGEIHYEGRTIKVIACPISIDAKQFNEMINADNLDEKGQHLKDEFKVEFMGIGVDRLDYTKGIIERFKAIEIFFDKYPEYKKRMTFVQIGSPTRTDVPMYRQLKDEVDRTVGSINSRLGEEAWVPIQYFYRNFSHEQLMPYFAASDFCLITPLRDGMNLVAKEYCLTCKDDQGVLVLSEMAGASEELMEALMVNPYDLEGMADAIHHALTMQPDEQNRRMSALRGRIEGFTVFDWVDQFIEEFRTHESRLIPAKQHAE